MTEEDDEVGGNAENGEDGEAAEIEHVVEDGEAELNSYVDGYNNAVAGKDGAKSTPATGVKSRGDSPGSRSTVIDRELHSPFQSRGAEELALNQHFGITKNQIGSQQLMAEIDRFKPRKTAEVPVSTRRLSDWSSSESQEPHHSTRKSHKAETSAKHSYKQCLSAKSEGSETAFLSSGDGSEAPKVDGVQKQCTSKVVEKQEGLQLEDMSAPTSRLPSSTEGAQDDEMREVQLRRIARNKIFGFAESKTWFIDKQADARKVSFGDGFGSDDEADAPRATPAKKLMPDPPRQRFIDPQATREQLSWGTGFTDDVDDEDLGANQDGITRHAKLVGSSEGEHRIESPKSVTVRKRKHANGAVSDLSLTKRKKKGAE